MIGSFNLRFAFNFLLWWAVSHGSPNAAIASCLPVSRKSPAYQILANADPAMPHSQQHPSCSSLSLGRLVATPNALAQVSFEEIVTALSRHAARDWGDVCPEDWRANEKASKHGFRILSTYHASAGMKFWIITEADRTLTTVLMPEDY